MKWSLSVRDWQAHAVDEHRIHPTGCYEAECGDLLAAGGLLRDKPEPSVRTCGPCADPEAR